MVSRVFLEQCDVGKALEDAVFDLAEKETDLTMRLPSGIITVQNVCSPAETKENRI